MVEAMSVEILADQPEVMALASLAAVPASKMAAAFNDAEHFFEHLSLDDLGRLTAAVERLGALSEALVAATEEYRRAAVAVLQGAPDDAD